MFSKPVTGAMSLEVQADITLRSPALPVEFLVHGWDALRAALRDSERDDRDRVAKNIAYAKKCQARVARHPRLDITEEASELDRAIADAERFF